MTETTNESTPNRQATAVLGELIEPGNLELYAAVSRYGAHEALRNLCRGEGSQALVRLVQRKLHGANPQHCADLLSRGAQLLADGQHCGARLILPDDPEWPVQLVDLAGLTVDDPAAAPPIALWVRGPANLRRACERSVSVVGARSATSYGTHSTAELAAGLARQGWTVVSGAAYGIDGAAHRGALSVEGCTVAVLACGVDRVYPAGHARLLERIAQTGAVISEWPPGAGPRQHRFLIRNRVIAALAKGVVVTQAARRSGSRVTARRAQELDRHVMALPGPVTSGMSVGPHELLRDWQAKLVTDASDVIAVVGSLSEVFADSAESSGVESRRMDLCADPDSPRARLLQAVPGREAVTVEW
ncbi:MAG: DNA-processing protein DprA, partial [Mycobacteriales bacterium]